MLEKDRPPAGGVRLLGVLLAVTVMVADFRIILIGGDGSAAANVARTWLQGLCAYVLEARTVYLFHPVLNPTVLCRSVATPTVSPGTVALRRLTGFLREAALSCLQVSVVVSRAAEFLAVTLGES